MRFKLPEIDINHGFIFDSVDTLYFIIPSIMEVE